MPDTLKRRIGPALLTAYGIGVMVGAGIYVLVGHAAGEDAVGGKAAFLPGLRAVAFEDVVGFVFHAHQVRHRGLHSERHFVVPNR